MEQRALLAAIRNSKRGEGGGGGERVGELEADLRKSENERKQLQEELEKAKQRVTYLERREPEAVTRAAAAQRRVDSLQAELTATRADLKEATKDHRTRSWLEFELQRASESAAARVAAAEDTARVAAEAATRARLSTKQARADVRRLTEALDALSARYGEQSEANAALKTSVDDLKAQLEEATAKAATAEAELAELNALLEKQDQAILAAVERVEVAEADNAALAELLSKPPTENTTQQQAQLREAEAAALLATQELDKTKDALLRAEALLATGEVDKESLLSATNELALKSAEAGELRQQLQAARERITAFDAQQEELKDASADRDRLSQALADAAVESQQARAERTTLQTQLARADARAVAAELQVTELQNDVGRLEAVARSEAARTLAREDEAATVLSEVRAELANARGELERLRVTLRQQRALVEGSEKAVVDGAGQLAEAQKEATLQSAQITELNRQLASTRQRLDDALAKEEARLLAAGGEGEEDSGEADDGGVRAGGGEGGASGGGDDDDGPTRVEVRDAQLAFLNNAEGAASKQDADDQAVDEAESVLRVQREFVREREQEGLSESGDEQPFFDPPDIDDQ